MTLTEEYLDKALAIVTKDLKTYVDKKFDVTNKKLGASVDKLDGRIDDLVAMTSRRFDEIERKLDVKDRVEKLDKRMDKFERAINI